MPIRVRALVVSLVVLAAAPAQAAPGHRIAVVVGANLGAPDDELLRFAEADARRVRDLLVQLGEVRPERALLVVGGGPAQLLSALNEARGRAAELSGAGQDVTLIFYYSGHGDEESLHLPRGNLPLADLRRELARIPARLRITVLDACRTGGRVRGAHRGPDFALAVAPPAPAGTVELRASSEGEAAQESEELAGAVFTHFLVSGLRGAADGDGDGQVSLDELYRYVFRRTLMRTGGGAALQHPAIDSRLAGAGEVVLTRVAAAGATLSVPGGAERYLVFALPGGGVMGELSGESALTLALPPGRFLVERRAAGASSITEVDLSGGGARQLSPREFRPISREELVARGGRLELHPWRVDVSAGFELAPGSADGAALRAGLSARYGRGALQLELDVAYVGGGYSGMTFSGNMYAIAGGPALGWRWSRGRWTVATMLGAELRQSWELLLRHDQQAVGAPVRDERAFGAAGPRTALELALAVGHRVSVTTALSFAALFRRQIDLNSDSIEFHPVIFATMGIGYSP
jgi:hypothetical protein